MPALRRYCCIVENRTALKISRKLIFGLLSCCVAFQRPHGGPWSILAETTWSLTSPRVKHISGSRNFHSSPQKDFCNNIRQKRSSSAYRSHGRMLRSTETFNPPSSVGYVAPSVVSYSDAGLFGTTGKTFEHVQPRIALTNHGGRCIG